MNHSDSISQNLRLMVPASDFTARFVATAIVLVFVIANVKIANWDLQASFVRHLVTAIFLVACLLELVGRRLTSVVNKSKHIPTFQYWAWLMLLGVYMVGGSLYARFELDVRETFLTHGIYLMAGLLYAGTISKDNLEVSCKFVLKCSILFGVFVGLMTIYSRLSDLEVRDTLIHEREFFIVPLLYALAFMGDLPRWMRIGGAIVITLASILALKSTPTIVLGLTLSFVLWRRQSSKTLGEGNLAARLMFSYLAFILAIGVAAAGWYYISYVGEVTPVGNIDFRQYQYSQAWSEFTRSPLIGTGYTNETGIFFNLWRDQTFNAASLPTHNDVLDILRSGGLIAFLLWLVPMLLVGTHAFSTLRQASRQARWTPAHDRTAWLLITSLGSVLVYFFNPVLSKAGLAILVWIFFALLAANAAQLRLEANIEN